MTSSPEDLAMLQALRARSAARAQSANDEVTLEGMKLVQEMLDELPIGLRKRLVALFREAIEAAKSEDNMRLAAQLLLVGVRSEAPAALLSGDSGGTVPEIPAEGQAVLDAMEGQSIDRYRLVVSLLNSLFRPGRENLAGIFNALDDLVLTGTLQVDASGHPRELVNAEARVRQLERTAQQHQAALDAKDREIADRDAEIQRLRTELARAQAQAGPDTELLDKVDATIRGIYQALGMALPVLNNRGMVLTELNGPLVAAVQRAITNLQTANQADAGAKAKLDQLTARDGLLVQLGEALRELDGGTFTSEKDEVRTAQRLYGELTTQLAGQ